jgi:hypothetical protein
MDFRLRILDGRFGFNLKSEIINLNSAEQGFVP